MTVAGGGGQTGDEAVSKLLRLNFRAVYNLGSCITVFTILDQTVSTSSSDRLVPAK